MPLLRAAMILGERTVRIGLMVVLLARLQVVALVIAHFVAILVRSVVAYFVANRYCFPRSVLTSGSRWPPPP
jgi:hypothetical protein